MHHETKRETWNLKLRFFCSVDNAIYLPNIDLNSYQIYKTLPKKQSFHFEQFYYVFASQM